MALQIRALRLMMVSCLDGLLGIARLTKVLLQSRPLPSKGELQRAMPSIAIPIAPGKMKSSISVA